MENVETLVDEHPFDIDLQCGYLSKYINIDPADSVDTRFDASSQVVDFSDELWLRWIEVVKTLSTERIAHVMSSALSLHPSPSVLAASIDALPIVVSSRWNAWSVFQPRPTPEKSALRFVDQALDKVGVWPDSHPVWSAARDCYRTLGQDVEQVRKLFVREIQAIPTSQETKQSLIAELRNFEAENNLSQIQVDHSHADRIWEQWAELEQEVEEYPSLWLQMIGKRKATDPPELITSLHARSVMASPRDPELWRQYCKHTLKTFKDTKQAVSILERAVRNCPYEGDLWVELIKQSRSVNPGVFTRSLELGISALREGSSDPESLWFLLSTASHLTLQNSEDPAEIREVFSNSVSILSELSPSKTVEALLSWLHAEASHPKLGGLVNGLASDFLTSVEFEDKRAACTPLQWVQLAALTMRSSAESRIQLTRSVYESALNYVHTEKLRAIVLQDQILFERTCGTLEQVWALEQQIVKAAQNDRPVEKKAKATPPPPKQEKIQIPKPTVVRTDEPQRKRAREEPPKRPHGEVVYVTNLAFSVDEYRLSQFFEERVAKPTKLTIVRDQKGRSKGFAYVEFESIDFADKAISVSGTVVEGREINIAPSTRAFTSKKPVVEPPKTFEDEKDKTNDYFRNLILQKQKLHR